MLSIRFAMDGSLDRCGKYRVEWQQNSVNVNKMNANLQSKLVRSLRGLVADEMGRGYRTMNSIDQDIPGMLALVRQQGIDSSVELTNSDLPGIHFFIIGVDGFGGPESPSMNWVLG